MKFNGIVTIMQIASLFKKKLVKIVLYKDFQKINLLSPPVCKLAHIIYLVTSTRSPGSCDVKNKNVSTVAKCKI